MSQAEADVRIAKEERPSKALAAVGQEDVPVVVRGESSEGVFNAAWLQSQGCGDATAGPLACSCPMPFLQMSQQVVPEPLGWGHGGMMAPDGGDALSHLPEDSRPAPCLVACDVSKKTSTVVPVHAAIRCALLLPFSADASKVKSVDWIVVRGADRAAAEAFWTRLGACDSEGVPGFLKFDQIYDHSPPFPIFLATQKPGDLLVLPPHALALCSAKLFALICWERLPISAALHRALPLEMPRPPRTHLGAPARRAGARSCLAAFCALRDIVAPRMRAGADGSLSASERFDLKQLVAAVERAQRSEARYGLSAETKAKLADPSDCACARCGRELFLFCFKEAASGAVSCSACAAAAHGADALATPPGGLALLRTAPVGALARLLSVAHELLAKASEAAALLEAEEVQAIQRLQEQQGGANDDDDDDDAPVGAGRAAPPPPPPRQQQQQAQQHAAAKPHGPPASSAQANQRQMQLLAQQFLAKGAAPNAAAAGADRAAPGGGGGGSYGGGGYGCGGSGDYAGAGQQQQGGWQAGRAGCASYGGGGGGIDLREAMGAAAGFGGGLAMGAGMLGMCAGGHCGGGGGGANLPSSLTSMLRSGAGPLGMGGLGADGGGGDGFLGMGGGQGMGGGGRGMGSDDKRQQPNFDRTRYKTQICRNWKDHGRCSFGPKCNFAHGDVDVMKPFQQILTEKIEQIMPVPQMPQMLQRPMMMMGQMGAHMQPGGMQQMPAQFGGPAPQQWARGGGGGGDWQHQERGADDPRRALAAEPPRMGAADPRMGAADPRMGAVDPRAADARMDPRSSAADPRMSAADPRASAADPRMGAIDPRMSAADPRHMTDPRGAARDPRSADPRSTDPRDRPVERDRERWY